MPAENESLAKEGLTGKSGISTTAEANDKDGNDPTAKVWSAYLSETAHYDSALVESWTSDMDGILIFAGLFSASVTAMIVESYKNLSPDPSDMTVALLFKISQQLDGNDSVDNMSNINSFQPSSSAVRVNIFWFFSLSLGLTCALAATLVQQWSVARSYLQAVQRRPAPHKKARIRSYLFQGMQAFGMPAVVESIPTLLHASVFLFFAGLVDFLYCINRSVALAVLSIVIVCGSLYMVVTILPIINRQCPYRTPLSEACWYLAQVLGVLRYYENGTWRRVHGSMISGREMLACADLPGRKQRDIEALSWTLNSLSEDSELLPFVEAIPAFLSSESGTLTTSEIAIEEEWPLFTRAIGLLLICKESGSLAELFRRKRAVACMNAISCLYIRSFDFSKLLSANEALICSAVMPMTRDEDIYIAAAARATADVIVEYVQRIAVRRDDSQTIAWAMEALHRWESLESLVEMIPDFVRSPGASIPSFGRRDMVITHSSAFVQDVFRMFRCYYLYVLLQSCQKTQYSLDGSEVLRRRALACMKALFYLTDTPEGRIVLADTRTPIVHWTEWSDSTLVAQYAICTLTKMTCQVHHDMIQLLASGDAVQDYQSTLALSRYLRDLRAPCIRPFPPSDAIDVGDYGHLEEYFEDQVSGMKRLSARLSTADVELLHPPAHSDANDLPVFAKVALYRGRVRLLLKFLDGYGSHTETTIEALELAHDTIHSMQPHLTARYSSRLDQGRLLHQCRQLLLPLAMVEGRRMWLRKDERAYCGNGFNDAPRRIIAMLLTVLGTISARELVQETKGLIQDYLEAIGIPDSAAIEALQMLERSEPLDALEDEDEDLPSQDTSEDDEYSSSQMDAAGMLTSSSITQVDVSYAYSETDSPHKHDILSASSSVGLSTPADHSERDVLEADT